MRNSAPRDGSELSTLTTITERPGKLDELRRGWAPLLACCFGLALGQSPHAAYTIGIMANTIHTDLGWPRGQILGATIVGTLVVILLGSTIGRLVDRLGPRRVALASTVGVAAGLLLLSTVPSNIYVFYVLWGFLTFLGLGTMPMTYAKIVSQWFDRSRGIALGVALASTGIAGAFYPFYLNYLTDGTDWRAGFMGLALLPLLISLPIQWLFLREPAQIRSDGSPVVELDGMTLGEATRDYRFWASAVAAMLLSFGTGGLLANLLPLLTDGGLSIADATAALAVIALSVTAGRLICGFLLDRMWAANVSLVLILPAAIGVMALTGDSMALGTAMIAVILIGLVTGAEYDMLAYITGRYFGRRHYSELFGFQFAIFAIGAGVAPAFYGTARDWLGSYEPLLYVSLVTMLASGALLYTLGRYPKAYDDNAGGH